MHLFFILLQLRLEDRDGGPIYTETDLSRVLVEPYNAISAAIFLLIVLYWAKMIWGKFKQHGFLSIAIPLLAVGGVGGTIYHAFRVSRIFLVMDWLPIMLLCLGTSLYFFIRIIGKWWMALLIMIFTFFAQGFLMRSGLIPIQLAVSINYMVMALIVLLPTYLMLHRTRFKNGKYVLYALFSFIAAITFRILDPQALLPMGTHFLWHVFGALACHNMIHYIFLLNEEEIMLSSFAEAK